jgi:hypothetical protein
MDWMDLETWKWSQEQKYMMHVRKSPSLPTFELSSPVLSLVAMEMHEVMNELHALYGAWVKDKGNTDDSIDLRDVILCRLTLVRRLSRGMSKARKGPLRWFEAKEIDSCLELSGA